MENNNINKKKNEDVKQSKNHYDEGYYDFEDNAPKEYKKQKLTSRFQNEFMPKKLWLLRLYIVFLTYLVKFVLIAYIGFSLYNLTSSGSFFGNLILGLAGFYIVFSCIATLFIAQIVSLFLNIHDNIEDVRNKTVNPNFIPRSSDEDEESSQSSSYFIIIIILFSLIFSYANLNNNVTTNKSETEAINRK